MSAMGRVHKPPFQFTLARLLAWVTVAAVCLSLWFWTPEARLTVVTAMFWVLVFAASDRVRISPFAMLLGAMLLVWFFLLLLVR